ncbi:unnamed protein product, partial [Rotaria socialis]
MLEKLLPRHLQLIQQINAHHLDLAQQKWPDDGDHRRRMSIIEDQVRVELHRFSTLLSDNTSMIVSSNTT